MAKPPPMKDRLLRMSIYLASRLESAVTDAFEPYAVAADAVDTGLQA
jgi:hypothetical protein